MALAIFLGLIVVMAAISARTIRRRYLFICKGDCLFSKILNEKRNIWVYLPDGEDTEPNQQQYPVVYLLDADEHYAAFRETIQQLNADGSRIFPDMIVVGITNTNRNRDLTPSHSRTGAKGKKMKGFKPAGGGDNFIAFIKEELIPYVASKYPVTSERILMGHSLGGLTVINILLHRPEIFNGYIASDPSMWWDNQLMLDEARQLLNKKRFDGKTLYFSIANTVPGGVDIAQIRKDTSSKMSHIQSVFELADILEGNPDNGLQFGYKFYDQDNHDSVAMKTAYDGMQFLMKQPVDKQL